MFVFCASAAMTGLEQSFRRRGLWAEYRERMKVVFPYRLSWTATTKIAHGLHKRNTA
jgi:hypothetical protein